MLLILLMVTVNVFVYDDGRTETVREEEATQRTITRSDGAVFSKLIRHRNYTVWLEGKPAVNVTMLDLKQKLRECEAEVCYARPPLNKRRIVNGIVIEYGGFRPASPVIESISRKEK